MMNYKKDRYILTCEFAKSPQLKGFVEADPNKDEARMYMNMQP